MTREILAKPRVEEDTPWKNILGRYFRSFLEYCLPSIAEQVQWERGYEFLDKELSKLMRDSAIGNRLADKLIKTWLKNNQEIWILIHLEVQGSQTADFDKRIYIYHYRLSDYYQHPVVSIAILTDHQPHWRPEIYREDVLGCTLEFRFLVIKILDYRNRKQELEALDNPFALVILSQLAVMESRRDPESRLQLKVQLTRQLYKKGWTKQQVHDLYIFIDWLIALPKALMVEYHQTVQQIEEENKMAYVSTAEWFGREEGRKEGREEGRKEGFQNGEATLLIRLLTIRFGKLADYDKQRIQEADATILVLWAEKLLKADKIEDIFVK